MSKSAAAGLPRSIHTLVISNDGASTSRDPTKFEFRDSDELSPRHGSTSPTKSEQSDSSTSNTSVYSNSDDQSKFPLHTSREHASEAVTQRAVTVLTPCPFPTLDSELNNRATTSAPAKTDLANSKSKPGRRSSLRISLASFMSRLSTLSKKKPHKQSHSKTLEGDQKETERLDRLAARTALLPLSLPHQLVLCKRLIHSPNDYDIQIMDTCSNIPMLVGYREGSHLRSKFRGVSLCLGGRWYATWTEPFLKARVHNHETTVKVCDHQLATAPQTTVVKAWQSPEDKHAWFFQADIPGPIDKTAPVKEDFEWRTRQSFILTGEQERRRGSYLVQISTQNVVAVLKRRLIQNGSSIVSLSFTITFRGSGQNYGGLWKIIVFAIGLCTYH